MQLEKEDTQQSKLNSKLLGVTPVHVSNILILSLLFIVFNKLTCKERVDIPARSPS